MSLFRFFFFFFFQAEDGIRDVAVTGVQTCALPISRARLERAGVTVREFAGREICLKGGGGPTCLTRPLTRDRGQHPPAAASVLILGPNPVSRRVPRREPSWRPRPRCCSGSPRAGAASIR